MLWATVESDMGTRCGRAEGRGGERQQGDDGGWLGLRAAAEIDIRQTRWGTAGVEEQRWRATSGQD